VSREDQDMEDRQSFPMGSTEMLGENSQSRESRALAPI